MELTYDFIKNAERLDVLTDKIIDEDEMSKMQILACISNDTAKELLRLSEDFEITLID